MNLGAVVAVIVWFLNYKCLYNQCLYHH